MNIPPYTSWTVVLISITRKVIRLISIINQTIIQLIDATETIVRNHLCIIITLDNDNIWRVIIAIGCIFICIST